MDKPKYDIAGGVYNHYKWRSDGTPYDWCIHGYCPAGGYGWHADGGKDDHSISFKTGSDGVPIFEGPRDSTPKGPPGGLVCMLKRQYRLCHMYNVHIKWGKINIFNAAGPLPEGFIESTFSFQSSPCGKMLDATNTKIKIHTLPDTVSSHHPLRAYISNPSNQSNAIYIILIFLKHIMIEAFIHFRFRICL